jgi:hypothetical protein
MPGPGRNCFSATPAVIPRSINVSFACKTRSTGSPNEITTAAGLKPGFYWVNILERHIASGVSEQRLTEALYGIYSAGIEHDQLRTQQARRSPGKAHDEPELASWPLRRIGRSSLVLRKLKQIEIFQRSCVMHSDFAGRFKILYKLRT